MIEIKFIDSSFQEFEIQTEKGVIKVHFRFNIVSRRWFMSGKINEKRFVDGSKVLNRKNLLPAFLNVGMLTVLNQSKSNQDEPDRDNVLIERDVNTRNFYIYYITKEEAQAAQDKQRLENATI